MTARDVTLQQDEFFFARNFLAHAGQLCDNKRQDCILLSDIISLEVWMDVWEAARTGFTQSRRLLCMSQSLGVEKDFGTQNDGQLGTMASRVFGVAYQPTLKRAAELSNFLDMADDRLTKPLQIRDGDMDLRKGRGLGVAPDLEKLDHTIRIGRKDDGIPDPEGRGPFSASRTTAGCGGRYFAFGG